MISLIFFFCLAGGIFFLLKTAVARKSNPGFIPKFGIFLFFATSSLVILLNRNSLETVILAKKLFRHYFLTQNDVQAIYNNYYYGEIAKLRSLENPVLAANPSSASSRNNDLFFLQLESFNSYLLRKDITPNFLSIADEGVFFPNVQGGSVQTIRGQEIILCSILPSLGKTLIQHGTFLDRLRCLPRILKENGYRTLFFHNFFNLDFAQTGDFMKKVGFDEVHAGDIMMPSDYRLPWGYREDIFLRRVLDYTERIREQYPEQKIFVYAALDASNHYPFSQKSIAADLKPFLPFRNPVSFREKIANTTFVQDYYLGSFYRDFKEKFSPTTNLFIIGDHAWPIGNNENNIFNEKNAWQENFLTSLIIVPAKEKSVDYLRGAKIEQLISQADLAPTALEIIGINNGEGFIGVSLVPFFTKSKNPSQLLLPERCFVSVQPFSGTDIALVLPPEKIIFHLDKNTVTRLEISEDGRNEKIISENTVTVKDSELLKKCLYSLTRR